MTPSSKRWEILVTTLMGVLFGCTPDDTQSDPMVYGTDAAILTSSVEITQEKFSSGLDATVEASTVAEAGIPFDARVAEASAEAAPKYDAEASSVITEEASISPIVVDAGPPCLIEEGLCNPMCEGQCGAKSCGYTPTRTYDFMCITAGNVGLYSACRFDDECQEGLVCESHICKKPCRVDDDCAGLDLFEGPSDSMPPEGFTNDRVVKDVCQPITLPEGSYQKGLRVCNRLCRTTADRICGDSRDVECRVTNYNTNPTTIMCESTLPVEDPIVVLDGGFENLQILNLQAGDRCETNNDCSSDGTLICNQGLCTNECASDNDCPNSRCIFDAETGVSSCELCDRDPGSTCSVLGACGCNHGSSCKMQSNQISACSPNGLHEPQSWCNKNADCAEGLSCIAGLCRPICTTDNDCAEGRCLQAVSGPVADIFVCAGTCDPVGGAGCGIGALCYPMFDGPAICVTEAQGMVPRREGLPCESDFECQTGLGCFEGTCRSWCRSDDDCSQGSCNLTDPARYGTTPEDTIGLCLSSP